MDVQCHGESGITQSCINAIIRLIAFGEKIRKASLLTAGTRHCFLLELDDESRIAVKAGFRSGYVGEGPTGLAIALLALERHGAEIEEYTVKKEVVDDIDNCRLTPKGMDFLRSLRPVRPKCLSDYTIPRSPPLESLENVVSRTYPLVVPFALIDRRVMDLAVSFQSDPDQALLRAYRRLEKTVSDRVMIQGMSGSKLFAKAFQGDESSLFWDGVAGNAKLTRLGKRKLTHPFI